MNGTTNPSTGRSVQLAVMAAPTTTVLEAVAESRRRNEPAGRWVGAAGDARPARRMAAAAA